MADKVEENPLQKHALSAVTVGGKMGHFDSRKSPVFVEPKNCGYFYTITTFNGETLKHFETLHFK